MSQAELNVPFDSMRFPSTSLLVEKPSRLCSPSDLLGGGHGVAEQGTEPSAITQCYTGQPGLNLETHPDRGQDRGM